MPPTRGPAVVPVRPRSCIPLCRLDAHGPPRAARLQDDTLEIMPLGAGQEVGRSCIICKFKDKVIMFDCGLHPGKKFEGSLPYLDDVDLESVDVCLITHFHIDHCAALPY